MRLCRKIFVSVVLAVAIAGPGCGKHDAGRPVARLQGMATYQGQPVESGGVSFSPQQGGKAVWATFDKGRYVAQGVTVGPVLVKIHALQATGKTIVRSVAEIPEEVSIVPDRYREGVLIQVAGDRLDLNFDLDQ